MECPHWPKPPHLSCWGVSLGPRGGNHPSRLGKSHQDGLTQREAHKETGDKGKAVSAGTEAGA